MYLQHRTIPRQLQGEVHDCLNTWLCQVIIHPSNSCYASQVVITVKKLGKFISVWIVGNLISSPSGMHVLYPTLIWHYRWCIAVKSSLLSTWHKDTCSCQWQKTTSRRLHLKQALQAYLSLHICHLAVKCQVKFLQVDGAMSW